MVNGLMREAINNPGPDIFTQRPTEPVVPDVCKHAINLIPLLYFSFSVQSLLSPTCQSSCLSPTHDKTHKHIHICAKFVSVQFWLYTACTNGE